MHTILGLLENIKYPQKDIFLDILSKKGFQIISINAKVREVSYHMVRQKEISDKILEEIRRKGYKVNNLFWVNLLMSSNEISSNVIIEDLWEEDLYKNYIKLILLEKSGKNSIIYPTSVSEKAIEEMIFSWSLQDNDKKQQIL